MRIRITSLLIALAGALASAAAVVAEGRRIDEQWGLTGQIRPADLFPFLAFVLAPYLFLIVAVSLARSSRAQWFVLATVVVTVSVSGLIEIPHVWEAFNPKDESYVAGAFFKYPMALVAVVVGFMSFDMNRLDRKSASNSSVETNARKSGAHGSL